MSPVELLRASADSLRNGWPMHAELGDLREPLAEILEAAADGIERDSVHYSCGSDELEGEAVADMAERDYGPALRLARGVLGVPDA